jgi:hypothetical protein
MKNIFAIMFVVTLASCGTPSSVEEVETVDSTSVVVDLEEVSVEEVDTLAVDM